MIAVYLLLACAIKHHSYVQINVFEPCSCIDVHLYFQAGDRWCSVHWLCGLAFVRHLSYNCRSYKILLFGPKTQVLSQFSRVQAHMDGPTLCTLLAGVGMNL